MLLPSRFLLPAALLAVALGALALRSPAPRFAGPATFLWAWERPEDLRFLDTRTTGVAFLATTLEVRGDDVRVIRRAQPLLLAPGTYLIAVTRIETYAAAPADPGIASRLAERIAESATLPQVRAVQIDWDARESERDLYRSVLHETRVRLPRAMPLSITALASWCLGDRWLAGADFDEAVPMLFQMGRDDRVVREHLRSGGALVSACGGAAGFGTDEAAPALGRTARTYWFSPKPWTPAQVARLKELR